MNAQLSILIRPLMKLLSKHHAFLFVTICALLLAASIYFLYDVLSLANPAPNSTGSTISGFDQKTIDQIKQLRDSKDTPDAVVFPSPRANPFVEK